MKKMPKISNILNKSVQNLSKAQKLIEEARDSIAPSCFICGAKPHDLEEYEVIEAQGMCIGCFLEDVKSLVKENIWNYR